MATEQIPSEPNEDEPIPKRSDIAKFARLWGYNRLGHEYMMLQKTLRQAKMVEDLALATRNGTIPDTKRLEESLANEDSEMNIGNETHFHMQAPPEKPEPAPIITPVVNNGPSLAKMAGVALLGAGLPAIGATGMGIYNYFNNDPAPVVQQENPDELHADIIVHPASE